MGHKTITVQIMLDIFASKYEKSMLTSSTINIKTKARSGTSNLDDQSM